MLNETTPLSNTVRRCLTIPLYLGAATLLPFILGLVLPAAAIGDLLRKKHWDWSRAVLALCAYLACEALGIVAAAVLWLRRAVDPRMSEARYRALNFDLQCRWAATLFACLKRIFSMRVHVENTEAVATGPYLLFPRHASTADTLVPAIFVSTPHRIRLRYVFKRELLWDPCLDIVGQRLPNIFIKRQSPDAEIESRRIATLAEDIEKQEGLIIYPEGTRFTPAKQQRALERVAGYDDPALVRAASKLRNVLPPRLRGPVTLLQSRPDLDVVFCAHTGFENVKALTDLFNGSLTERLIRVSFRREPHQRRPQQPPELRRWLFDQWTQVDDNVTASLAASADSGAS